jgi:predicted fused transcriptional regulator/phosphomethylpyrimidine kinase/predicted transcriptional regulator
LTSYRHALIKALAGLGWTQQKIAETLFLTQAAVSTYLKKDYKPEGLDRDAINDLVNQSVSILQKDPAGTSSAMDLVCRACKMARSPGASMCTAHVSEIPVLGEQGCTICTKYLNPTIMVMEDERRAIIDELLENFHRIANNKRYVSLIPEVQSNLVLGFVDPERNGLDDYAGFPGRIIKHESEALITGTPAFGASKHIARIVSIVRKHAYIIRSATCITYNKTIGEIMARLSWTTIQLDNENDEAAINAALEATSSQDLDALVFKGIIGMEPLTFILGRSATAVIDRVEQIISGMAISPPSRVQSDKKR